jgi:hypothetical protein
VGGGRGVGWARGGAGEAVGVGEGGGGHAREAGARERERERERRFSRCEGGKAAAKTKEDSPKRVGDHSFSGLRRPNLPSPPVTHRDRRHSKHPCRPQSSVRSTLIYLFSPYFLRVSASAINAVAPLSLDRSGSHVTSSFSLRCQRRIECLSLILLWLSER